MASKDVVGYVVSNYAGDLNSRSLTTCYALVFSGGLSIESLLFRMQFLNLSITEVTETVKEAIMLKGQLVNSISCRIVCCCLVTIRVQFTCQESSIYSTKTKHIDMTYMNWEWLALWDLSLPRITLMRMCLIC